MRLNVRASALSLGIVWGLLIFLFTWWLYIRQISVGQPTLVGKVYPFYTISPLGSLLGLIYGFIDGLITGGALAWLYNRLQREKQSE
jgi:hypothetical protein